MAEQNDPPVLQEETGTRELARVRSEVAGYADVELHGTTLLAGIDAGEAHEIVDAINAALAAASLPTGGGRERALSQDATEIGASLDGIAARLSSLLDPDDYAKSQAELADLAERVRGLAALPSNERRCDATNVFYLTCQLHAGHDGEHSFYRDQRPASSTGDGERGDDAVELTGNVKGTKVCCPGCKRRLGDVFESLVRQRGKFKAQRNMARRDLARLDSAARALLDELNDNGWRCTMAGPVARALVRPAASSSSVEGGPGRAHLAAMSDFSLRGWAENARESERPITLQCRDLAALIDRLLPPVTAPGFAPPPSSGETGDRERLIDALLDDGRVAAARKLGELGDLRLTGPNPLAGLSVDQRAALADELVRAAIDALPPAVETGDGREVDGDLVRAVAYCRLGGERPKDSGAFARAEQLGLLSHHGTWQATTQGEGLLIALGMLGGAPAPEPVQAHVLWEVGSGRPQLVAAFTDGLAEAYPESYDERRREAEQWYRDFFAREISARFSFAVDSMELTPPSSTEGVGDA